MNCPLYYYLLSLFIYDAVTVLKSTLPDISYSGFPMINIYMVYFSILLLLIICDFILWVSYRQYKVVWFFFHFSNICLFIGEFRSFVFYVIIDMVKLKSTILLFASVCFICFFQIIFSSLFISLGGGLFFNVPFYFHFWLISYT